MLTIILSILFWVMPEKKGLGVAAIVMSAVGFIMDIALVGILAVLDLIFLIVNVMVFNKYR